jgi:hypothetical protein
VPLSFCLLKKVSQTKGIHRFPFILRFHDLAFLHFRRFGQVGYLVTVQTWQRTKSWRASCHFAIFPSLVNFDFHFILSLALELGAVAGETSELNAAAISCSSERACGARPRRQLLAKDCRIPTKPSWPKELVGARCPQLGLHLFLPPLASKCLVHHEGALSLGVPRDAKGQGIDPKDAANQRWPVSPERCPSRHNESRCETPESVHFCTRSNDLGFGCKSYSLRPLVCFLSVKRLSP